MVAVVVVRLVWVLPRCDICLSVGTDWRRIPRVFSRCDEGVVWGLGLSLAGP